MQAETKGELRSGTAQVMQWDRKDPGSDQTPSRAGWGAVDK